MNNEHTIMYVDHEMTFNRAGLWWWLDWNSAWPAIKLSTRDGLEVEHELD
jgi:hypothetical protein